MEQTNFQQEAEFSDFLEKKGKSRHLVGHHNCDDYPGMVLAILISFEPKASAFDLDLEWSCYGLDFYGDTLQESYQYRFDSMALLMGYLENKYMISITDIPIQYKMPRLNFPILLPIPVKSLNLKQPGRDFKRILQLGSCWMRR